MSVTISLSASVTMACLFTPKVSSCVCLFQFAQFIYFFQLHIILFRPDRNVRPNIKNKGLSKPPQAGSTSMMSTVMVTVTTCNQKEKIQRHMSIVEAKTSTCSGEFDSLSIFFVEDYTLRNTSRVSRYRFIVNFTKITGLSHFTEKDFE